ncbi:MAG TPA: hypothetical protein VHO49_18440 [Anaerolineales bacterium]|nr:hypothetical protein [Anaerolineales bacterium]
MVLMLLSGFLILAGIVLLVGWQMGGRINTLWRNLGVIIGGSGLLLFVLGLILYFTTG